MIKTKLLFSIFSAINFSSVSIMAAESTEGQKVKKDLSGYGTMDMNQFNSLKNAESNSDNIKFDSTCKTEDGVEIPSSSPQFSSCMQKAQIKQKEKQQKR